MRLQIDVVSPDLYHEESLSTMSLTEALRFLASNDNGTKDIRLSIHCSNEDAWMLLHLLDTRKEWVEP